MCTKPKVISHPRICPSKSRQVGPEIRKSGPAHHRQFGCQRNVDGMKDFYSIHWYLQYDGCVPQILQPGTRPYPEVILARVDLILRVYPAPHSFFLDTEGDVLGLYRPKLVLCESSEASHRKLYRSCVSLPKVDLQHLFATLPAVLVKLVETSTVSFVVLSVGGDTKKVV
jgi:hypothetical protein